MPHLVYSLALGTVLRLAEIVGWVVGDVHIDDKTPLGHNRRDFRGMAAVIATRPERPLTRQDPQLLDQRASYHGADGPLRPGE